MAALVAAIHVLCVAATAALSGPELKSPALPGDTYAAHRHGSHAMITNAYDMEMLPARADRRSASNHGWCFGLPPGIASAAWPLDRRTGHPMPHAFTLLLPEDYRVHGPEQVAVSFFGTNWQ